MVRTLAATAANFFFPGLGNLILGQRALPAVGWLLGVAGLTFVELSLQAEGHGLYWPMFASVFVMNTGFAIDAFREGRALEARNAAAA